MTSYASIPLTWPDADLLLYLAPWLDPSHEGTAAPENWSLPGPDEARRRIGVFRWPRTASQWATACFLATTAQADAVRQAAVQASYTAMPLVLDDGTRSLTAPMHMAGPPRPLCQAEVGKEELWLLDLVDERYFWRGRGVDPVGSALGSWVAFWAACAVELDEAITPDDVAEEYGGAPIAGLANWWDGDLPALMDAVAASAGQVVVRELLGGLSVLRHDTSLARHQANLAIRPRMAGGEVAIL